jgi:hypothetical protein
MSCRPVGPRPAVTMRIDPHLWVGWSAVGMLGSLAAACGADAGSSCDGAAPHGVANTGAVSWGEDERLHILDPVASALLTTDSEWNLLRRQPISEHFLTTVIDADAVVLMNSEHVIRS